MKTCVLCDTKLPFLQRNNTLHPRCRQIYDERIREGLLNFIEQIKFKIQEDGTNKLVNTIRDIMLQEDGFEKQAVISAPADDILILFYGFAYRNVEQQSISMYLKMRGLGTGLTMYIESLEDKTKYGSDIKFIQTQVYNRDNVLVESQLLRTINASLIQLYHINICNLYGEDIQTEKDKEQMKQCKEMGLSVSEEDDLKEDNPLFGLLKKEDKENV